MTFHLLINRFQTLAASSSAHCDLVGIFDHVKTNQCGKSITLAKIIEKSRLLLFFINKKSRLTGRVELPGKENLLKLHIVYTSTHATNNTQKSVILLMLLRYLLQN